MHVYVCVRVQREALRGVGVGGWEGRAGVVVVVVGGQGEDDRTAGRLFERKQFVRGSKRGQSRRAGCCSVVRSGHGSRAASCLLITVSASIVCLETQCSTHIVKLQCQTFVVLDAVCPCTWVAGERRCFQLTLPTAPRAERRLW